MYARPQGPLGAPSFARSSNPKKNPDQLHIFIYKSYIIIYRSSHDKCQTMEPSHFFKLIPLLSKDHSSNNPPDPPDRIMVGVVGLETVGHGGCDGCDGFGGCGECVLFSPLI